MLVVTANTSAIEARISNMQRDIADLHLKVPEQFNAWQSEDMHRDFPNVEAAGEGAWFTRIWPRSRRSRPMDKKRRRAIAAPTVVRGGRVVAGGGRPILRAELFEMLSTRMRALLATVKWKKK